MHSQSDQDRLVAQEITRYLASNPSERLRDWVSQRTEPFCLEEAAQQALGWPAGGVRRQISTRIGNILIKELGCRRFRSGSPIPQFWYMPPQGESNFTKNIATILGEVRVIPTFRAVGAARVITPKGAA